MSIDINENIFRLNISVYHILVVEIFNTQKDLRKIEFALYFIETLQSVQMKEYLTACA
jgi:hypothetical protein